MRVITWQSSNSAAVNICIDCEKKLDPWPRDHRGEEYSMVSYGLHDGRCDICHHVEKGDRFE